ncbi:MAG: transposase, partial [Raoultibacter sp.]
MGFSCDVIAVSSIPRSIEDKQQKDDKRDAQRLLDAVVSPNSKCKTVVIPSEEAEAARDLVRTYYDLVLATKRLKMQFSGMLLRHGVVWNERTPAGNLRGTWTRQYVSWASSIKLPEPAGNTTLGFYLESVLAGLDRCNEIRNACLEVALSPRFKPYVDALTRLKGVDDITALTYAATMDDFGRFRNGRSVSSYFGLTPSRKDSGEKTGRNGAITKAGDTTVRKAIVEGLASLPNFNGAKKWQRKGREVSNAIEVEATKCNIRNLNRYKHLVKAGRKPNVAKVAVASEVVREMWVLGLMA